MKLAQYRKYFIYEIASFIIIPFTVNALLKSTYNTIPQFKKTVWNKILATLQCTITHSPFKHSEAKATGVGCQLPYSYKM